MYHYRVPEIGDGTFRNRFRPDVPAGVSYVCYPDDGHGFFLVVTNVPLEDYIPLSTPALAEMCKDYGVTMGQLMNTLYMAEGGRLNGNSPTGYI